MGQVLQHDLQDSVALGLCGRAALTELTEVLSAMPPDQANRIIRSLLDRIEHRRNARTRGGGR